MPNHTLRLDPRYFQVIFQAIFLSYGLLVLDWKADWLHFVISIAGCLLFQYSADSILSRRLMKLNEFNKWGFSVLISAMSLCLLLKTNYWEISLLTAFLTVASKYVFKWNHKHIFNPSAFGIIATILITDNAWLSPGQWGWVFFFNEKFLGRVYVVGVVDASRAGRVGSSTPHPLLKRRHIFLANDDLFAVRRFQFQLQFALGI